MTRDLALLGLESAEVMWRRSLVLARCDKAAWRELEGMIAEKAEATWELRGRLLTGSLGPNKPGAARAALAYVRRKVRANRRRLRR